MLPFLLESNFNITGYSIFNEETLDLSYNSNSVYLWEPQKTIQINKIALTGNISGTGEFKIYILDNEPHLLLDFNLNNQTINFEDYSLQNSVNLDKIDKYFLRFETGDGEINLEKIYYSDSIELSGSYQIIGLNQTYNFTQNNNLETTKDTIPMVEILSLNTSLEISNLEFDPYSPNQYENALVLGRYEDDGSLNGTIDIEFYVNSLNVFNDSQIVESGNSFNFTLEKGNFTLGDNLSIIITANDSENITQKQLQAIVGLKGPVINSILPIYEILGLGITNNFTINATDGNYTIDSVWGNVVNRKNNVSLTFTSLGNVWTSSYKSYVLGNHTIDVYVNDTNGIVEHDSFVYLVDTELLLRIETEKTNYTLNEDVRINGIN